LIGVGLVFGFSLSRMGFSSWDEVHHMFLLSDFRLILSFASAVGALALIFFLGGGRLRDTTPRRIHPGTLVGGALFGVGWALSGACPAIAWVQLGEGQMGASLTLLGVVFGNWAYAIVHERFFRWPASSCLDS
jgi:hypothetical protein